jgi:hypothetical protein
MRSFVVGPLVRSEARSAIHPHFTHQGVAAFAGPISLQPAPGGETAVLFDRRSGFSHAIPGYPHPMPQAPDPREPAADVVVGLSELPVTIRYRLDRPPIAAATAGEYAARAALAYAQHRTPAPPEVRPPRPEQLLLWGVEAAAIASYPLQVPDAYGADIEELVVLVRGGAAIALTLRFPRAAVDWLRAALLRSAALSNLRWTGEPASARIWPPSDFLERGLWGALAPHRQELCLRLAPMLSLAPDEAEEMSRTLSRIVGRPEPPWFQLPPHVMAEVVAELTRASANPNIAQIVHQGMAEVLTMHDLRGLCILLGQAITAGAAHR